MVTFSGKRHNKLNMCSVYQTLSGGPGDESVQLSLCKTLRMIIMCCYSCVAKVCALSYFADVKELNFLEGVLHDDLARKLKESITGQGKLTADDFDDLLPNLTARLGKLLAQNYLYGGY